MTRRVDPPGTVPDHAGVLEGNALMRLDLTTLRAGLLVLLPMTAACLGVPNVEDDSTRIGEEDAPLLTRHIQVKKGQSKRYKVPATFEITAELQQDGMVPAQLRLTGNVVSGHAEFEAWSEVEPEPKADGIANQDETRVWWVRVYNRGEQPLEADLVVTARQAPTPPPSDTGLPTLADPVQYENDYCVYSDSLPYVRAVKWTNPLVQSAMRAIGPGWRSTFSYGDWRVAYALENANAAGLTDDQKRDRTVRNYMRVLCGEHRDYPAMLQRKLELITEAQVYAGAGEMQNVDTTKNLFTQITYPAYEKMVQTMQTVHAYRQGLIANENDGFNYGYGRKGEGWNERWNRVENSVPPWTHCEMKFMFEHYMSADAPAYPDGATYVAEYEQYKTSCTPEDFETMYNFRGHKNFQPLWLESNAFIWNSHRGRGLDISRGDHGYYQHPFATRYQRSRQAWASYILYRDEDNAKMIQAGDNGGGPIMYLTDQDTDADGLADYRLFDQAGCGDQGVGGTAPDSNCNMVSWDLAFSTPNTTGHASGWEPSLWATPDMGFMTAFTSLDTRMARLNAGLDRHTNWGPTGYYQIDASDPDDTSPRFVGAYSPIVACSYDISASNNFASGDYPSTPAFEQGVTKWMYIMRFKTADYYSEADMRAGRPIDFDKNYFNETSLSNDYYRERALDRFGWVPLADMYANIYFVYGARGEQAPELTDIPAPGGA